MNCIKYRGKKMLSFNYSTLILIMCSLVFTGCSYPPLKNDATLSDDYTYIIGPGDNVNIFVWGHPDVSMSVPVRPDGKITLPLVEDVVAIGKTPYEMARTMEKELAVYIRDPKVVVMVTGFQGVYEQQVRIVGQIGGGNRYSGKTVPYEKGMTLLDLIIIIGQIGWYADGNRASIIRNVNGKPQQFGVRMDDLVENADMSLNVKIMPGDILVIPEAFF